MVEYEIFETLQAAEAKNDTINAKYGVPNDLRKTDAYRDLIKKYDEDKWAGMVCNKLKTLCSEMPEAEKLGYFNEPELVPFEYLEDNNWFVS